MIRFVWNKHSCLFWAVKPGVRYTEYTQELGSTWRLFLSSATNSEISTIKVQKGHKTQTQNKLDKHLFKKENEAEIISS